MTDHDQEQRKDLSRREVVKRGAVVAGTLVWATPVVQTVAMSSARANGSPPPAFDGPSYVAMNVQCNGQVYFVKFEGDDNAFEDEPGSVPDCGGFTPASTKADGTELGMSGTAGGNCITINTGGCSVIASAVKKGQGCTAGAIGSGVLNFCS